MLVAIYEKLDKPYFLGTPEELATLHTKKIALGHFHELHPYDTPLGMEGTYFGDHLTIWERPHHCFVTPELLDALEPMWSRTARGYNRQLLEWTLEASPLHIKQHKRKEGEVAASVEPLPAVSKEKPRSLVSRAIRSQNWQL